MLSSFVIENCICKILFTDLNVKNCCFKATVGGNEKISDNFSDKFEAVRLVVKVYILE